MSQQPVTLRMDYRIGSGAFSTVFRHPDGRVYKLFKERDENGGLNDLGVHEPILRRSTFNSEVEAYIVSMRTKDIRPFVPTFHGIVQVEQVIGLDEKDMSKQYMLDCCYVIDFVEGEVSDFTQGLAERYPHLLALTLAFAATGINHWIDGAVFHAADPEATKVVDFALRDEYGIGERALALQG